MNKDMLVFRAAMIQFDMCKQVNLFMDVPKKYNFNQSCFIGRANASFNYLKRYREDIDTLRSLN